VGGTILLIILCGVILFVRSYYKRRAHHMDNTENISQLSKTIVPNPMYVNEELDVDYVDNGK